MSVCLTHPQTVLSHASCLMLWVKTILPCAKNYWTKDVCPSPKQPHRHWTQGGILRTLDMQLPNIFPPYCMGPHQFGQIIFSKDAYNVSPLHLLVSQCDLDIPPLNGGISVFSLLSFMTVLNNRVWQKGSTWPLSLAYKNAMFFHFVPLGYLLLEPSYHLCGSPRSPWKDLCKRNQGPQTR